MMNPKSNMSIEQLACILYDNNNESTLQTTIKLQQKFLTTDILFKASREELLAISGVTEHHYQRIQAIAKLFRQHRLTQLSETTCLNNVTSVVDFLRGEYAGCEQEIFVALFLNCQNHLLAYEQLAVGTIDECRIYAREVVKRALYHNAASIIFAHNHPSHNAEPSNTDIILTQHLVEALQLMEVRVHDHLIICANQYTSLAERGYIS